MLNIKLLSHFNASIHNAITYMTLKYFTKWLLLTYVNAHTFNSSGSENIILISFALKRFGYCAPVMKAMVLSWSS